MMSSLRARRLRAATGLLMGALVFGGCATTGGEASPSTPSWSPEPAATPTPTPSPTVSCVDRLVDALTPDQRAGQLIVVALGANETHTLLDPLIAQYHLSGVVLLSGWD